ncbi:MAG: hypothetical protein JRI95_09600 [Deltaproteobacteria bacterium]|nr:hypothetical protein [Deltaproteobacteria bacterium]MBW2086620.1 hypothetical protein [Deltaproteobacteria bacterium]
MRHEILFQPIRIGPVEIKNRLVLAPTNTNGVSSSRAFIADPEWANKVWEDQAENIQKCRRCNRCIYELFASRPVRCTVNKKAGRERFDLPELLGI